MSEDRGIYADIISNDIGGILASIEGEIYGPGVPSLDPGLNTGDSVPVAFILPNSSRQPLLLARRPVLKEFSQGVLDHFTNLIPMLIAGLWVQGGADELVSSETTLPNGKWVPTSAGGPSTLAAQTYYAPAAFESVLGVIAFLGADGYSRTAWLGNVSTAPGIYTLRLMVGYLGFGPIFSKDLSTHATRTDSTLFDTGLCFGFLFYDRAFGVIHVIGSGSEQQKVWTVDPVSGATLINGVDLGYSLHQSSVGAGFLIKGWQNRRSLSFANDRSQQSSTFNFWGYRAAIGSTDAHFANLGTLDPATLFPTGYELAVTRAKGVDGLGMDTEEGRCPINPVTREFITWLSAWDTGSISGVADVWMNNGFLRTGITCSGVFYQRPAAAGMVAQLEGGHRNQRAGVAWISLADLTYTLQTIDNSAASPLTDANSVGTWSTYYSSGTHYPFGATFADDIGRGFPSSSYDSTFYASGYTWAGVAGHRALDIGGHPISFTMLVNSDGSTSAGTTTPAGVGFFQLSVDPPYPGSAGAGYLGSCPVPTPSYLSGLAFPDLQYFAGGHQVICPVKQVFNDRALLPDDLINWPIDGDEDWRHADPCGQVTVDPVSNAAWLSYIEPYTVLEGNGNIVLQGGAGSTVRRNRFSLRGDPTIWGDVYVPNFSVYLCPKVRLHGRRYLAQFTKTGVVRLDISNYLAYQCEAPFAVTTPASLSRPPMDTSLAQPILLPTIGLVAIVEVWRDALAGNLLTGSGLEHLPYIQVRFFQLAAGVISQVGSAIKMLDYNTLITLDVTDSGGYSQARQWDWLSNPVVVKCTYATDGSPVVELHLSGTQAHTDGTQVVAHRCWQLTWPGNGSIVQHVYDLSEDLNHPIGPVEAGSQMFANNCKYWAKRDAPNDNWILTYQPLT